MSYRVVITVLLVVSAGCGKAGVLSNSSGGAALGTSDQHPIVVVALEPGTSIRLANVTYDQNGRIDTYDAIITNAGKSQTVKVHQDGAPHANSPPSYVAEVNGKAIPEIRTADGTKKIGFSLNEQGGAVLTYIGTIQLDLKSELGYDSMGRAHVKRQTFTHEGRNYDIVFTDHVYDKNGRLAGYKVQVVTAS